MYILHTYYIGKVINKTGGKANAFESTHNVHQKEPIQRTDSFENDTSHHILIKLAHNEAIVWLSCTDRNFIILEGLFGKS